MGTTDESRQFPLEVRAGVVLAGRYRVERLLGSGGMGVVFAAQHVQLAQRVALKFLLPEIEGDPEAKSRFAREAWTTAKIKSEHVVRVIDVGELPSGAQFLVMEYLEGIDLASMLAEQGRLPIARAIHFALQACEGIAEAHALGIVHRDLKPSNFFCVRRSDGMTAIKILDFGVSKLLRRSELAISYSSITAPTLIMGSLLYMSPEQMNSAKEVDARSDIWSLGVILYQMLTGELPFVAEMFPELAVKIAIEPPPPLRAQREEVPRGLERVVLRCLEKDRNKRFEDVAQLAMALAEYAPPDLRVHAERARRVLRAHSVEAATATAQARPSAPLSSPAQPARGYARSRPSRIWLLAPGVLLLAGLTVVGGARILPPSDPHVEAPKLGAAPPAASTLLAEILPEPQPPAAAESLTAAIVSDAARMRAAPALEPPISVEKPSATQKPKLRARPVPQPREPTPDQDTAGDLGAAQAELDELGGRN